MTLPTSRTTRLLAVLALGLAACGTQVLVPPSPPDAGASRPDASVADAGAPVDAGEPFDAGAEPDAGTVDAGQTPDAGDVLPTPDAGGDAPDAGPAYWTRVAVDGGTFGSYPPCVGAAWPLEPEIHVPEGTPVTYGHAPPASGPHWPCWAPWTTASKQLRPERFVHNLEHGGIALLYRCEPPDGGFAPGAFADGGSPCPDEAAAVAALRDGAPLDEAGKPRYLVTSQAALPTRFAAVAWGWTLELDALDADSLACFARAHLSQAPENYGGDPPIPACLVESYPP